MQLFPSNAAARALVIERIEEREIKKINDTRLSSASAKKVNGSFRSAHKDRTTDHAYALDSTQTWVYQISQRGIDPSKSIGRAMGGAHDVKFDGNRTILILFLLPVHLNFYSIPSLTCV